MFIKAGAVYSAVMMDPKLAIQGLYRGCTGFVPGLYRGYIAVVRDISSGEDLVEVW